MSLLLFILIQLHDRLQFHRRGPVLRSIYCSQPSRLLPYTFRERPGELLALDDHAQMRALVIASCIILGGLLCARWIVYYNVINNVIQENTAVRVDRQFEAVQVTDTVWYNSLRTVTYILQYFATGVCMIALSVSNVRRLNALNRAHCDDQLRMCELARNQWTRNHKVFV
jgi:hypothetical protein